MSRPCAAISPRFASGARASVHLLANTSGLSEYLPKALAAFLRAHPAFRVDVEERESGDIARAIAAGAADLGLAAEHALPEGIERIPFSEDRLVLVVPRQDELASRRQIDFAEVVSRDFVGLITSSALHAHVSGHAAKLGARLRFRARLNNFDAIGQMVAAGIGVAVMPEVAARRSAGAAEDRRGADPRRLGQSPARALRTQFQGAIQAGAATGRAFAEGGAALNYDSGEDDAQGLGTAQFIQRPESDVAGR